ncbi:uncharacterized protein LOC119160746 isoform X2 [Rhipicephalus microplus]|uniref:uncharacterized protein LOC119160746 isoform X2 n=1 Tax=Rhipicephalus microplus TaxID=6941 RepID=UPI003F6B7CE6
MVYCCVPFCKSSDRRSTGISFHEFPVTQIRQEWLKKISRQAEGPGKQPWEPSDRSKVCSLHFKPEDYREGLKLRKLKPDAIPSIFPSYPGYMQEPSRKERQPVKRCAVPGLSPDKPHAEAKKNRPDIPSPYRSPSEKIDEQKDNCVAGSSTAHQEDEILTEPCSEPSSLPLLLPAPESSFCLPKTYQMPKHGKTVHCQTSPSKATRPRGMQTRLSLSRMTNLLRKVQNLTRKCQRLQKKQHHLQEELSTLRQEAKKASLLMKRTNVEILQQKVEESNEKALFLQEQLAFLGKKKGLWREETVRKCVLLHAKSPAGYRLLREIGVLTLPSRCTLKRYIGACTGEVVSSLIKQRLHAEVKLHSKEARCGSLVMDEMSLKQSALYHKQSDALHGFVDLGGAEVDYGLEEQLATHLLCFVFVGLSTHYRLPVGYYFTKGLTGEQLEQLSLKVMQSVEDAGFEVVRLVADNHSTNCKFFASLSGGQICPVVTHPLDPDRQLFLSFDYCHIIKNVRNQFLDTKRIFRNAGVLIVPDYLRNLHDIQEKQAGAFRLVRCLTKKHLWPSNFQKMSVARAVAIFSPQVTSVLRFLLKHAQQLGFHGFDDSLPTIEFMELVYKWFTLHNIKSTSLFWMSRDALRMPFYGPDDERLLWLENECLIYFDLWKESTAHKLEFLSEETYEALRVTTMSTVLCTRHLLGRGFHFVLTGKFSSDDVESLFSTIRQLNGSNDQTDAYAALSSLQKILVTGCIHSSPSGNVGSVIGSIGEATKLAPQPAAAAPPDKDIKKLLLPYLTALEHFPSPPTQSLRASTLALIAGFLVRAVQDNSCCEGCLMKIQAPKSSSTTTALIAGIDRGGLSYPSLPFVGFLSVLEGAASKAAAILVKGQKPLQKFSSIVLPSLLKNSLFACTMNNSVSHRAALLNLILRKFMRPFLANYANNLTEAHSKRKLLNRKPLSRKVLKV